MEKRAAIAFGILLAYCPCASALNPSLDINQYAHTAWAVREGFFKGGISSIAQTPDGNLWLGTEFGLLRFDGVRSVVWQPPAGEHLPSELAGQVRPLLEDREGTVWAGGFAASTGRLSAIRSSSTHFYGEDGSFGREVISLYEDSRGYLWAGAVTGLWRWKPGPPKLYPMPDPVSALMENGNGALLIVMRGSGIRKVVDGKTEMYPLPGAGRPLRPIRLLRDRNGGLWIGMVGRGMLHVNQGRTDLFARSEGLSGDFVQSLFEDREGNIWVAASDGLDRFRDFAIPAISVKQGLSNTLVSSALAAKDGSVWLGTSDGLNRWDDGRITIYRKRSSGLPATEQPSPQSLRRLDRKYSLAAELNPAWGAKPPALSRHEGRPIPRLKDPRGKRLDWILERYPSQNRIAGGLH